VGQHAQEHVRVDPVGQPVPDGAHVQFGVQGAEEGVSFHLCKSGVVHHRTAVRADRRSDL
jgi:hypothetical protein